MPELPTKFTAFRADVQFKGRDEKNVLVVGPFMKQDGTPDKQHPFRVYFDDGGDARFMDSTSGIRRDSIVFFEPYMDWVPYPAGSLRKGQKIRIRNDERAAAIEGVLEGFEIFDDHYDFSIIGAEGQHYYAPRRNARLTVRVWKSEIVEVWEEVKPRA